MFGHVFQKQWELVFSHEGCYSYPLTCATPIHTQTEIFAYTLWPVSQKI